MLLVLASIISFVMMAAMIVLYVAWAIGILFGEEDFITSKKAVQQIAEIIEASEFRNGIFYDLGSCRGTFVFGILNRCPNLQIVGVDKSPLKTWLARLRKLFYRTRNSPTFLTADIFETDVSKLDWAFVYLPRPLLPDLELKLQKELKPGAHVITYRVNFPHWQHTKVFLTDPHKGVSQNSIFLYQKV